MREQLRTAYKPPNYWLIELATTLKRNYSYRRVVPAPMLGSSTEQKLRSGYKQLDVTESFF